MKNKKNLLGYPKGYLEVDETLLRKLGVNPAVLFAAIIQQARTSEEETFQFEAREIEKMTGIKKKKQQTAIKTLKDLGLIKCEKKGSALFFKIDNECYCNYKNLVLNDE